MIVKKGHTKFTQKTFHYSIRFYFLGKHDKIQYFDMFSTIG